MVSIAEPLEKIAGTSMKHPAAQLLIISGEWVKPK
jgi:hypothetical protein